ncbi:hypothetical protein MASR1M90_21090 [Desulfovibrionales bacterium]
MPIYEYCCEDCHQIFEEWQKDFQDRDRTCPVCSGTAHRLISNTSFVLKGGGWYASGYSKSAGGNGAKETAPPPAPAAAPDTSATPAS